MDETGIETRPGSAASPGLRPRGRVLRTGSSIGDLFPELDWRPVEVVDDRLPRAVSAIELSRAAERIVAAAPKLLAVGDQRGQRQISTELDAESGRLLATVDSLGSSDVYLPTSGIEPIVSALASDLAALGELVARRLTVAEQISARRRSITLVGSEVDRLLAPWIEIIESEIAFCPPKRARDRADRCNWNTI